MVVGTERWSRNYVLFSIIISALHFKYLWSIIIICLIEDRYYPMLLMITLALCLCYGSGGMGVKGQGFISQGIPRPRTLGILLPLRLLIVGVVLALPHWYGGFQEVDAVSWSGQSLHTSGAANCHYHGSLAAWYHT